MELREIPSFAVTPGLPPVSEDAMRVTELLLTKLLPEMEDGRDGMHARLSAPMTIAHPHNHMFRWLMHHCSAPPVRQCQCNALY
jgi:hypothetical protein